MEMKFRTQIVAFGFLGAQVHIGLSNRLVLLMGTKYLTTSTQKFEKT